LKLPIGYVYEKFAEDKTPMGPGHKIILTFDDGLTLNTRLKIGHPRKRKDTRYFFVIGLNAENNIPPITTDFKDGYEIGNHTFTHHNVGQNESRTELNWK
jgi:peptidoglycan/xylan/chitin deacetylase (PgdA/CDA1 family)